MISVMESIATPSSEPVLWFGARVDDITSFALIGCTVTPGFDYKDFELGTRSKLIRMFPKHKATILSLTNE
jgi:predicted cupin superfamily sugar epimerase